MDQKNKHNFKILIIGDSSVGKSSLLNLYSNNEVSMNIAPTLGCDYKTHEVIVEGKKINLFIWDTAGQEKYRSIARQWYKQSQGVILVYSVIDRQSFVNMNRWINDLVNYIDNYSLIITGNKTDLNQERTVTYQEAQEFANQHKVPYFETTIFLDKKPNNAVPIKDIIVELTKDILKNEQERMRETNDYNKDSFTLQKQQEQQPKKGCGC